MNNFINKISIVAFALANKLINNTKEKHFKKRNVLVLFHEPGIGDIICALDLIDKLELVFPEKENYKIFIAIDRYIYNFLSKIYHINKYEFIVLDIGEEDRNSFGIFRKNFKKLNSIEWERVVSFERLGRYLKLLIMGLATKSYYLIEFESFHSLYRQESLLNFFLNDLHIFIFNDYEMLFLLYEKAIFLFTGKHIHLELPKIDILNEHSYFLKEKKYCIISCGIGLSHSNPFRVWPLDRFAKVIMHIRRVFHLDIYLCGSYDDIPNTNCLLESLSDKSNIYNFVGKTNFNEWIELIRNAEFVLGNDSGYIHLAAAVDTQAFVIIGFWNYGRFHPYQTSKEYLNYKKPILITAMKPECALCSFSQLWRNNPKAQFAKSLCIDEVKNNGTYKCISDISVKNVIDVLNNYYLNVLKE